jgi:hypothetical protein
MNRPLGYGLAVVATTLTLYYGIPLFLAVISLGEICAYSPAGTGLCAEGSPTPQTSGSLAPITSPGSAPGEPGSVDDSKTSPELNTAELCKEPGIRYAGRANEGAEVCFTLTSDRSSWIEIGFGFVRASGCPDSTTAGRAYYEGPEPLAGPGRLAAPGFRATIRGSRASGVLEDSVVCPGKRFKWSAGRVPSS